MENGRDIADADWERYDTLSKSLVSKRIEDAKPRTNLHQLGLASFLLALRDADNLGTNGRKSLKHADKEAYQVLELRRTLVEARRTDLLKQQDVQDALRSAEQQAAQTAFGNPKRRAEDYKTFLLSDVFWDRVRYKGKKPRSERMSECLMRLNALDPSAAEQVAHGWVAKEMGQDPGAVLCSLPTGQAEKAARDLLDYLASLPEVQRVGMGHLPAQVRPGSTMNPAVAIHECLAAPEQRAAIARALTRSLRAPGLRRSLQTDDAQTIFDTLKHYNVEGAQFADKMTKSAFLGRGIAAVFSLWSVAAVYESFPPRDGNGRLRKEQLAAGSQAAIGMLGSAPAFAKLVCPTPDTKQVGAVTRALAHGSKIKLVCGALSIVGDCVGLYFACRGVEAELKNEDTVGVVTNIASCIASVGGFSIGLSMICGGAACPPLLIGAAALAIGAALVDGFFGQSALTGKVYEHLRDLGISGSEEDTREEFYASTRGRSRAAVRACSASATLPLNKRLELINGCAKGKTKGYEETTIWKMFADTRAQPQAFVWLIESTDPARVADELEDTREAADLLKWTLLAYDGVGRPPGRGFAEQLLEHCRQHRWKPLHAFIDELSDSPRLTKLYQKVSAATIKAACQALMKDKTNAGAEYALCHLLVFASMKQLNEMFSYATNYARDVKDELEPDQWKRIYRRINSDHADQGVRYTVSQLR